MGAIITACYKCENITVKLKCGLQPKMELCVAPEPASVGACQVTAEIPGHTLALEQRSFVWGADRAHF